MKIAVFGGGRIGSVFAFHLSSSGHEVCVIARGDRLRALQEDQSIVTVDGRRAPVSVSSTLDPSTPYDLVIVTTLELQIQSFLSELASSAAKTILFMFNSFFASERYRSIIGGDRLQFGFPAIVAFLENHRLNHSVNSPGMVVTLPNAELAAVFKQAGLPTEVESDMDSFLRSHVVMVLPFFLSSLWTWERKESLTWSEAKRLTGAWTEGFEVVRSLGHKICPRAVANVSKMPRFMLTAILWAASRSASVKKMGEFGPAEARWLIDAISTTAQKPTPILLSLRP